jgi:hypothetical protein
MPPNPDLPPIHVVRGQRVLLDGDLARLYGVSTTVFNQAIRRNHSRFPSDFIFEISHEEYARLISQIVTSKRGTTRLRSQSVILAATIQSTCILAAKTNPLKGGTRCPHRVLNRPPADQPDGDIGLHLDCIAPA